MGTLGLTVSYRVLSIVRPLVKPSAMPYFKAAKSAAVGSEASLSVFSLIWIKRLPERFFISFFHYYYYLFILHTKLFPFLRGNRRQLVVTRRIGVFFFEDLRYLR
jgi:hypothetical protein